MPPVSLKKEIGAGLTAAEFAAFDWEVRSYAFMLLKLY
jgi:hypothetical protein